MVLSALWSSKNVDGGFSVDGWLICGNDDCGKCASVGVRWTGDDVRMLSPSLTEKGSPITFDSILGQCEAEKTMRQRPKRCTREGEHAVNHKSGARMMGSFRGRCIRLRLCLKHNEHTRLEEGKREEREAERMMCVMCSSYDIRYSICASSIHRGSKVVISDRAEAETTATWYLLRMSSEVLTGTCSSQATTRQWRFLRLNHPVSLAH